eukprot:TRINITY_DN51296_c0_g1_i1.p1 TRINITY_DN51296_c0_g1~~TRINITY_DN51296_c0_g1_i1.p1  ORF type:complete len:211 (-),score=7.91 TRINITY_DN51296_c0_g1_i1:401-1033(-)
MAHLHVLFGLRLSKLSEDNDDDEEFDLVLRSILASSSRRSTISCTHEFDEEVDDNLDVTIECEGFYTADVESLPLASRSSCPAVSAHAILAGASSLSSRRPLHGMFVLIRSLGFLRDRVKLILTFRRQSWLHYAFFAVLFRVVAIPSHHVALDEYWHVATHALCELLRPWGEEAHIMNKSVSSLSATLLALLAALWSDCEFSRLHLLTVF